MSHFVHMQIANDFFLKKINYDTRDVFVTRCIAIVHGILKQKVHDCDICCQLTNN